MVRYGLWNLEADEEPALGGPSALSKYKGNKGIPGYEISIIRVVYRKLDQCVIVDLKNVNQIGRKVYKRIIKV